MAKYLGQVLAVEADVRRNTTRKLSDAYYPLQKPAMLEGLTGEYEPNTDPGEELPAEEQRVQATVEEMITTTRDALAELFDITAARDYTNGHGEAHADVEVDGRVLIAQAPIPYLLWLDKRLDDLQSFAQSMPTLSPSTLWEVAEDRGVYKSLPVKTARTVQQHKVITVAPATEHHQAQAQIVAENVSVGTWTRIKYSGAVPVARKEQILRRIATLRAAAHAARAKANRVQADEPEVGAEVLAYLFD